METERRVLGEDPSVYTDVPYTTTDLSPYSNTSSYSGDSSHNDSYYGEFDWHQNSDPNRMYYPLQDRMDISMHSLYPGYTTTTPTDVYQPNALWHPQPVEVSSTQMAPVASILPSMNFTRSQSENSGSHIGPNGKPKRKRIQTVPQRKAANVRERKRMFHLNEAFDDLRLRLPAFNYEKRLSRIETLRLAITYIGFMKDVTDGKDPKEIKLAKNIHMDSFSMPGVSPSSSKDPDTESE